MLPLNDFTRAQYRAFKLTSLCLTSLYLAGCASQSGVPHHAANQFVTTFYASVYDVTPVQFESHAQEAALWGALDGALLGWSEDEAFVGALFGAAIYSVATSIAEGDLQGYEVSLKAVDGDMVTVILDNFEGYPGQCVFVKVALEVTTEVVNTSNCDEVDLSY